ncbi:hypothetical protein GA0116948_11961 [Chitinophaga costaii]|uniref:LTXXQ motif family protein n=1 Tax=Chitinophaga costaii TaxID=1335309 RepID=A0A1C4G1J8_9BACT|nr:hypothetical protein [Chitinophaga costaii]PUZ19932.1 hypothetical protein DCM91_19730 [Chitinophaga costaii]SCC61994.1 hypothetical protein GA0116948_11961 [Chitinophaga costaii]
MKTAILLPLFLVIIALSPARAQQDTSHSKRWTVAGRADKMSDKLKRELKLTSAQNAQILAINTDIIHRTDSIKHNSALPQKEKMQQLQGLSTERNQRFKSVLTAQQYKKFNDWNMQKKEHLEAKMDRKAAGKSKINSANTNE